MKNQHGVRILDCLNNRILIDDYEGGSYAGACIGFENQGLQFIFDNEELQYGLIYWWVNSDRVLKIIESESD